MRNLLQVAIVLALLAFGVSTMVLTADLHKFLKDSDAVMLHVDETSADVRDNMPALTLELHSILQSADLTARVAQLAAAEQRAYWQKTSVDSDKTVKAVRLVVDRAGLLMKHTDEQLNGSLIPDVDRELLRTSQAAQVSITSIGQAADTLKSDLNDLPLRELAGRLNETALHLDGTALALQHTAESGQHVAKFYEDKLTKPASLAKQIGMGALDIGAKLGSVFAGFVR